MSVAVILNIYCKQFIRHDRYMISVQRQRKGLCEGFFFVQLFELFIGKQRDDL